MGFGQRGKNFFPSLSKRSVSEGKAHMPSAGPRPPASVSLSVSGPWIEQPHHTKGMGCLGSYLGTNRTQKAQSPGWSGACLTVRAEGAGQHRPPSRARATEGVISAVFRSVQCWGKSRS